MWMNGYLQSCDEWQVNSWQFSLKHSSCFSQFLCLKIVFIIVRHFKLFSFYVFNSTRYFPMNDICRKWLEPCVWRISDIWMQPISSWHLPQPGSCHPVHCEPVNSKSVTDWHQNGVFREHKISIISIIGHWYIICNHSKGLEATVSKSDLT